MQIRKPVRLTPEENNHDKVLLDTYKALRGNISFGKQEQTGVVRDNIDCAIVNISNTGLASTNFSITHNLNRIPVGVHPVKQSDFGIYKFVSATKTTLTLQCNLANVNVTFCIF